MVLYTSVGKYTILLGKWAYFTKLYTEAKDWRTIDSFFQHLKMIPLLLGSHVYAKFKHDLNSHNTAFLDTELLLYTYKSYALLKTFASLSSWTFGTFPAEYTTETLKYWKKCLSKPRDAGKMKPGLLYHLPVSFMNNYSTGS